MLWNTKFRCILGFVRFLSNKIIQDNNTLKKINFLLTLLQPHTSNSQFLDIAEL